MTERIIRAGDPVRGVVRYDRARSAWWTLMTLGWLVGGTVWFTPGAAAVFLGMSILTLCGGHSLGMHRWLIHHAFACPLWLGRLGVWLGTLVGLGGPHAMIRQHDLRDWAQRQGACHPYLRHGEGALRDFFWQVHCRLDLDDPPAIDPGEKARDPFLAWLQRWSWTQHVGLGALLFVLGGPGWVAWGSCGRVSVGVFGHWLIGHLAHGDAPTRFAQPGAAVQGRAVPLASLITFGESWHDNHHAYPSSARLGLLPGQADPGWWTLRVLERLGLVWDLRVACPPCQAAGPTVSVTQRTGGRVVEGARLESV